LSSENRLPASTGGAEVTGAQEKMEKEKAEKKN